jgi:PAP2 superfamily
MTTSGDRPEGRDAMTAVPAGLGRRQVLGLALGTAVTGAAGLVARPAIAGAQGGGTSLLDVLPVDGSVVAGRADVVADWFDQVVASTPMDAFIPGYGDRLWGISWMAALAALGTEPGGLEPSRRRPRFAQAAVATAVHDALVALVPDEQVRPLDAALAASLAAIPDGDAKGAGTRAGRDAAARTLAERAGDGLDPVSLNPPFTPPPEAPGVYRLPPGATATQGAGWGAARPFLLGRADRFRPAAPPPVGSDTDRGGLEEVRRFGGAVSERTERQSDVAWLGPQVQYVPALRALIRASGRPVAWKVRLLAAYAAATTDGQIATGDAKFHYLHWRPVTAIHAGDPYGEPDTGWSSYLPTPPNPEYPSAHAVIAGAAEAVLTDFVGPRVPVGFTATYRRGDGKVVDLVYPRGTPWTALTQDNVDARVWAGVHWRYSDEVGAVLGRQVGAYAVRRLEER